GVDDKTLAAQIDPNQIGDLRLVIHHQNMDLHDAPLLTVCLAMIIAADSGESQRLGGNVRKTSQSRLRTAGPGASWRQRRPRRGAGSPAGRGGPAGPSPAARCRPAAAARAAG